MSQHKIFPLFSVRSQDGKPCGHQHQHEEQAENCAINKATRERGRTFTVVKRERGGSDIGSEGGKEIVMSHFEVKLKTAVAS